MNWARICPTLSSLLAIALTMASGRPAMGQDNAVRAAATSIANQAKRDDQILHETIPVLFRLKADGASRSSVMSRIAASGSVRAAAAGPESDLEKAFNVVFAGTARAGEATAVSVKPRIANPRAARVLGVGSARLTQSEIELLLASPDLEVSYDTKVQIPPREIPQTPPPGASRAAASQGATAAIQLIQAPQVWGKGYKGDGITVAVIDTGVSNVSGLTGRLLKGTNTITLNGSTNDDQGHGTHVAGTIAGSESSGVGVAPLATILPIKALDHRGVGTVGSIANGIFEALDLGANVINISVEVDGQLTGADRQVWDNAIAAATKEQCPIALAAGNQGESNRQSGLAKSDDVIVVGAVELNGAPAPFTGQDGNTEKPLVSAPGVLILSFWRDGRQVEMSGTSMATPHVAGVLALLKSKSASITVADCRSLLQRFPLETPAANRPGITGVGIVDAFAVITEKPSDPGSAPPGTDPTPPPSQRLSRVQALIDPKHPQTVKRLNERSDGWIKRYKEMGITLDLD